MGAGYIIKVFQNKKRIKEIVKELGFRISIINFEKRMEKEKIALKLRQAQHGHEEEFDIYDFLFEELKYKYVKNTYGDYLQAF